MELPNITTYQALVYQSRAQRVIKSLIQQELKKYNLTMMQWSVLGFIYEAGKQGVRISDLARALDTSLAFITNSVNVLEAKGMVYRVGHETDSRSKLVCIDAKYRRKFDGIEKELGDKLWTWLKEHIDTQELAVHLKVVRDIASYAE